MNDFVAGGVTHHWSTSLWQRDILFSNFFPNVPSAMDKRKTSCFFVFFSVGLFYYSRQADCNEVIHILWGHDVVITFVQCCPIQQGITTSIHFFSKAISGKFSCSISDTSVSKVLVLPLSCWEWQIHITQTHTCACELMHVVAHAATVWVRYVGACVTRVRMNDSQRETWWDCWLESVLPQIQWPHYLSGWFPRRRNLHF